MSSDANKMSDGDDNDMMLKSFQLAKAVENEMCNAFELRADIKQRIMEQLCESVSLVHIDGSVQHLQNAVNDFSREYSKLETELAEQCKLLDSEMNQKQKNDELIRELNTLLDNNNPILAQLYELDDVESKNDNSYELNQLVENIALLRAKLDKAAECVSKGTTDDGSNKQS